ncbi:hypothetical protein HGRIS_003387 [Hohenbuehelia grisea]|uniref:Decapping nuclease n=1 Tax=Hohenbuehelia grisea TaxID=104357 RepID=A0ABR3JG65_9AGAR
MITRVSRRFRLQVLPPNRWLSRNSWMSKRTLEDVRQKGGATNPKRRKIFPAPDPPNLAYASSSNEAPKSTPFQRPTPLITFSYTPEHELEFSDSALRYFVDPPIGAQLGYGFDRWIRRPDEKGRIDSLLKAWSKLRREKGPLGEIGAVSWRGVMTKILTAPYEVFDGWDLNVMFIDGTMYFEEHLTEQKLYARNNLEPRHERLTYFGYAFESYCTSEHQPGSKSNPRPPVTHVDPDGHPPGWSGDVNTNIQWCNVIKTKLGNTRLIIGGEVDCVRGQRTAKLDNLVELKTSMAISSPMDETKFEKKLLKFFFQSFLLGVPEIVVGFRNHHGTLTTVQSFQTMQLPRLVRGKRGSWDPQTCLEWADRFIQYLRQHINDESVAASTGNPSSERSEDGAGEESEKKAVRKPPVWRVKFVPKSGVFVNLLDEEGVADVERGDDVDRVGFLPRWYYDEVSNKSNSHS